MRKSDLKSGMRVVLRNGERYIVVGEILYCSNWGFMNLNSYNDELTELRDCLSENDNWDIVKIYSPTNISKPLADDSFTDDTLLWERKELSERDKKVIDAIRLLHPNYKWIARDRNNKLYACRTKPVKGQIGWNGSSCISIPEEYLQFIQWNDKEPYYIGE